MKIFLKEVIDAGKFEGVSVTWKNGFAPTLHMQDESGEAVETHRVENWSVKELKAFLNQHGFYEKGRVRPLRRTEEL